MLQVEDLTGDRQRDLIAPVGQRSSRRSGVAYIDSQDGSLIKYLDLSESKIAAGAMVAVPGDQTNTILMLSNREGVTLTRLELNGLGNEVPAQCQFVAPTLVSVEDRNGDEVTDLVILASEDEKDLIIQIVSGKTLEPISAITLPRSWDYDSSGASYTIGEHPRLVVGAPGRTKTNGAVVCLSLNEGSAIWVREGRSDERYASLGRKVLPGVDFDRDGVSDVLAAAHEGSNFGKGMTDLHEYVEAISGADGRTLWAFELADLSYASFLGDNICIVGDCDIDGVDDVLIGEFFFYKSGEARIHLVSGRTGKRLSVFDMAEYFGAPLIATAEDSRVVLVGACYYPNAPRPDSRGGIGAFKLSRGGLDNIWSLRTADLK